ncbi:MAG: type III-B CRISPR module RAMP protein Cmr1 [Chthonomonadales bacterium]|nr:type III-B CRISPR module RAMP protein Cmr1 [Chthonomonadales bacterium]
MSRKLVDPPDWREPEGDRVDTYRVKVITAMFGGGFATREVDRVCTIRPAAIRGHLRFWWRATAGGAFATPEKLHEHEAALWGDTGTPGRVAITVTDVEPGKEQVAGQIAGRARPGTGPGIGYFVWPFQAQQAGIPEAAARTGVEFTLGVALRDPDDDAVAGVRRALKAWLTLGGIGARTRRGCGALRMEEPPARFAPPPGEPDLAGWLDELAGQAAPGPPQHPTLSGGWLARTSSPVNDAWRELAEFWAAFRKGHVGSVSYEPMSGGKWSDYRQTLVRWRPSDDPVELCKPFLGLPLNYQRLPSAPFFGEIVSEKTGRMASPVILRPVAFDDGEVRPVVLALRAPAPAGVRVKKEARAVSLRVPPNEPVLRDLGVNDPLAAVRAAIKLRWGAEPISIGAQP